MVAALAFSEAYSRGYLTLHWFTDIVSGLIYGTLILSVFIATIRLVAGPAGPRAAESPATVPEPVTTAHPDPQLATSAPGLVGAAPDLAAEGSGPQPSRLL